MSDSSDYCKCDVCKGYEICTITQSTGPLSGIYTCFDEGHKFCKNCFPEFHKRITSADNIRRIVKEEKWAYQYYHDVDDIGSNIDDDPDEEVIGKGEEILQEYYAEVPSKECPMCQKKIVRDDEILEYLLKKLKTTRAKVIKEMRVHE